MNKLFIVFFCILITSIICLNIYTNKTSDKLVLLINEKIDKVLYEFFNELVTSDVINKESVNNLLEITRNSEGEILTVNYDLEKTYTILTNITKILKKGITDLENGKIDVEVYDKYLKENKNGLVMYVPIFIASDNIFINNFGPMIPIKIDFNENMLTNIKTKVTNYGLNNALLEIYISVEMKKTIITPLRENDKNFYYDILVGALVINGRVPNIYDGLYESNSKVFNLPLN